ncbi:MAG: protein kinase [Clostridiales bacterium]|jgi:serine/threonine protein kinase|nr:protein kinase [Clostridiales bacterium]
MSDSFDRLESKILPWRKVRLLGSGAFGKVYEIEKEFFGNVEKAALKVLSIDTSQADIDTRIAEGMSVQEASASTQKAIQQISAECALMAQIKGNSNIVSLEDHQAIEREDGSGWDFLIRMELLKPIYDFKKGPMPEAEIIRLGIDVCRALEVCLTKGIVHRDIKPANILLSQSNSYKLGDFGVARQLEQNSHFKSMKGTYSYMAPEVYLGGKCDFRVDIYSLGLVLYSLSNNNRTPFLPAAPLTITADDRDNATKLRIIDRMVLPAPAKASKGLAIIIAKACAYNPENRYKTPAEFRKALESLQDGKTIPADHTGNTTNGAYAPPLDGTSTVPTGQTEILQGDNRNGDPTTGGNGGIQKNKMIPLFIIALVASLSIAVFAIFFLNPSDGDSSDSTASPPPQSIAQETPDPVTEPIEPTEPTGPSVVYRSNLILSTYAGTGERGHLDGSTLETSSFGTPGSMTISSDGTIYIADDGLIRVIKNGAISTINLDPSYLKAALVRCNGNDLYIIVDTFQDESENLLFGLIKLSGQTSQGIALLEASYFNIADFAFSPDGTLYALCWNAMYEKNYLTKFDSETGDRESLIEVDSGCQGMAISDNGSIYIANAVKGSIWRYDIASSEYSLFAGADETLNFVDSATPRFFEPRKLFYKDNALYVLDFNLIRKLSLNPSGSLISSETLVGKLSAEEKPDTKNGKASEAEISRHAFMDFVVMPDDSIIFSDPRLAVIRVAKP